MAAGAAVVWMISRMTLSCFDCRLKITD